jgi:hypothetical protein
MEKNVKFLGKKVDSERCGGSGRIKQSTSSTSMSFLYFLIPSSVVNQDKDLQAACKHRKGRKMFSLSIL